MTSRFMGRLKRKGFGEVGVDYFDGDADVVTSTKKLRLLLDWREVYGAFILSAIALNALQTV